MNKRCPARNGVVAGEVVPDLQVVDGDLVGDRDRPEGLTRLDLMKDLAIRIRCGDLDRDDQLRDGWYAIGTSR